MSSLKTIILSAVFGSLATIIITIGAELIDYGGLIHDVRNLRDRLSKFEDKLSNIDFSIKRKKLEKLIEEYNSELFALRSKNSIVKINNELSNLNILINSLKNKTLNLTLQNLPIGTIICSTLNPELFITDELKELWALADGRLIPRDSNYPKALKSLPDLRTTYIRGYNSFSDEKGKRYEEKVRDGDFLRVESSRKKRNPDYTPKPGDKIFIPNVLEVYYYVKIN